MALARQRPTEMVNAGFSDDARTMSGLSPVARSDRPRCVPRNRRSSNGGFFDMGDDELPDVEIMIGG